MYRIPEADALDSFMAGQSIFYFIDQYVSKPLKSRFNLGFAVGFCWFVLNSANIHGQTL